MADIGKSLWSRWEVLLLVFIVLVAIVIAGGYVSYTVMSSKQAPMVSGPIVKNGDAILVDYIGMFEDGTVFDTSIRSVAENHTMYPKSLSFNSRLDYSPMSFTVGSGQMIAGFDKGVIGMALNQTKVLVISPEDGYGMLDESLIEKRALSESVPIFESSWNTTTFFDTYQIEPVEGTNVKNMKYGWNMTVFHVDSNSGKVIVKNNPFFDEVITSSYGWNSKVLSIDSSANKGIGEIVIRHLLTNDDVGTKYFNDEYSRQFMVTMIDLNSGTFTVDFNGEVVGRTLIFKVTLVSLTPAP